MLRLSKVVYMVLRAGSHGISSPTHVNKSQHGGKGPTFEPQEPSNDGLYSSKLDLDFLFFEKKYRNLC